MTRVLNIECPDRKGIVHAVTGILLRESLNIVGNQEFVDQPSRRFFMRTEVDGPVNESQIAGELKKVMGEEAIIHFSPLTRKRLVALASKEHHCLADLLIRHQFGELGADLVAVVSNHERLRGLAEQFGVPFHFAPAEGQGREAHEAEILRLVDGYTPDYLALAKYMRVLSSDFVGRFPRRIVNIHHSFLPAFVGAQPYRQAFERGVKVIGATAHFVTEDLDEGPIIVQQVIPVDHSHSPEDLARAGRDVEQIVLAKALGLVFEDRVFVCGSRTILFD